jgi:hypothetical protein
MSPRVSFRQTMSGNYWRLDTPTDEHAIAVTFEATASDWSELVRHKTWRLTGTIDADRLASARAVEGTLGFHLFDERRVPYRLSFLGDDGRRYELSGQKEWSGLAPVRSMTLLAASLYGDDGEELGRATLRFDWRSDWARWIKSFRLRLS